MTAPGMGPIDPKPWPIDFKALQRGKAVDIGELEVAFNESVDSKGFRLRMLALRDDIVQYFRLTYGDIVAVVCSETEGLRVLTHAEQAEYVQQRAASHVRGYALAHAQASAVDRSKLSDTARERLDRFQALTAFRLAAMRRRMPPSLPPPEPQG